MQIDYTAATLNGRTLDHCLGETVRAEVYEILLGEQYTVIDAFPCHLYKICRQTNSLFPLSLSK